MKMSIQGQSNLKALNAKDTPPQKRPSKKLMMPHRVIKYHWLRLLRLKGDPLSIARGIAVGVFVGITPTIPLHTILTITICGLLRANIIAAIIANWLVSNPLTIPIEYYLSWKLGRIFFGEWASTWGEVKELLFTLRHSPFLDAITIIANKGLWFIISITCGGIALAAPFCIIAYFLYLKWFIMRKKRLYERLHSRHLTE